MVDERRNYNLEDSGEVLLKLPNMHEQSFMHKGGYVDWQGGRLNGKQL